VNRGKYLAGYRRLIDRGKLRVADGGEQGTQILQNEKWPNEVNAHRFEE
jgi:hypothetical protein